MKTKSRFNTARKVLIFWCLFIGIGAVGGATCMLIKPDGSIMGMQGMLPFFQVLPFSKQLFQNYIFPGISLLIVNGVTNLIAAALLFAKKKAGVTLGGIFGFTLMLWICIQFVIFPANFMSTIYFIFGLAQLLTGVVASVFYKQESFVLNETDYTNVGSKHDTLVIFFSRMGYTKKLAFEKANELGADLYEIKANEKTDGTAGFWWCGRYGMHKWPMPVEDISVDLSAYNKVIICSPIWVFNVCAPVRGFCEASKGKIKSADYVLLHHQKSAYLNAADEMDKLLGIKRGKAESIRCRLGKYYK